MKGAKSPLRVQSGRFSNFSSLKIWTGSGAKRLFRHAEKRSCRQTAPFLGLRCRRSAAAAVVAAAAVAIAVPEQDEDQNDDPPPVAAEGTEAGRIVIARHNETS